jgi:hypothetical protein
MNQRVIHLSPLQVTPGMCLARAVSRADGVVLLAAGSELTKDKLAQLTQRGVEVVFLAVAETRDEETIAAEIAATEARVTHLFRGEAGMARSELRQVILAYRRDEAA